MFGVREESEPPRALSAKARTTDASGANGQAHLRLYAMMQP